jgi:hypothetical protein
MDSAILVATIQLVCYPLPAVLELKSGADQCHMPCVVLCIGPDCCRTSFSYVPGLRLCGVPALVCCMCGLDEQSQYLDNALKHLQRENSYRMEGEKISRTCKHHHRHPLQYGINFMPNSQTAMVHSTGAFKLSSYVAYKSVERRLS